MAIFFAATYFIVYLMKIQQEMRVSNVIAYKLVVNELSLTDSNGYERISITSDNGVITFYDENHVPRATMDMLGDKPMFKLKAEGGSVELAFHQEGAARITLRDKTDNTIWSAP
ncbi:MAG: hypothetical protein JRJ41_06515 [Deltaproteobacteria bacterium]|nr:hypothetical protein [Deltaproteobacteria bacterium]